MGRIINHWSRFVRIFQKGQNTKRFKVSQKSSPVSTLPYGTFKHLKQNSTLRVLRWRPLNVIHLTFSSVLKMHIPSWLKKHALHNHLRWISHFLKVSLRLLFYSTSSSLEDDHFSPRMIIKKWRIKRKTTKKIILSYNSTIIQNYQQT